MLLGNRGVNSEEVVDGFARFEKVDECLHRHSSACKAGCTVQDLFIDGQYIRQSDFLFRDRHSFLD